MSEAGINELLKNTFWPSTESKVSTAAMLLSLTSTLSGEERVKSLLRAEGLKFAVTEVGGKTGGEFQDKVSRSIIGCCLNNNIIHKTSNEIHALLHAVEEAKRGMMVNVASSVSLAIKVAVVRDDHWIAVAMYGQSAIHPITNHHRSGLGVMHL
ncbi:HutP family protein [Neobacillus sp. LXY-4]|uniref:HutP family protein n=1 Tax=Neobacillus sp. LXY-4 TaxID=3379826 RepID=UPI003EE13839